MQVVKIILFVDEIRTTGKITPEKYDQFVQSITSTGNNRV